jgi:hypothetical protein
VHAGSDWCKAYFNWNSSILLKESIAKFPITGLKHHEVIKKAVQKILCQLTPASGLTLKIMAAYYSETPVAASETTGCHNPDIVSTLTAVKT